MNRKRLGRMALLLAVTAVLPLGAAAAGAGIGVPGGGDDAAALHSCRAGYAESGAEGGMPSLSGLVPFLFSEAAQSCTNGGASGSGENALPAEAAALRGWEEPAGYQYVQFGRYEQETPAQPILWRVLYVSEGHALMLSERVLDVRPFDLETNEWEYSEVRYFLNRTFYKTAFTREERAALLPNGQAGRVFLPSRGELSSAEYGFETSIYVADANRSAYGTKFALDGGLWQAKGNGYVNYYVRSKANSTNVYLVAANGKFTLARIDRDNVGIRPAIWVDVEKLNLTEGDGSMENPFW